jgi:hypothetical protein
MASGRFSKQGVWFTTKLNNNYSDTVAGGALSTAPAGLTPASQFQQTLPGDRIILSPTDAYFWSNTNVGNLYTGTYRYVATSATSTSTPTRGHAAFWNTTALGANNTSSTATDATYQVTSDEAANIGVALFAGVFINNTTKGNYWWIQESGKATCSFRTAITGTAAIGSGVYLTGAGNNANATDVGSFDQLVGANSAAVFTANSTTAYTTVDNMLVRYVGPAETLPSNGNTSLVDLTLSRASFRW